MGWVDEGGEMGVGRRECGVWRLVGGVWEWGDEGGGGVDGSA